MKIYTKTGDKGETALFTGRRVKKDDPFIQALGTIDECNSAIGLAIAFLPKEQLFLSCKEQLETIQHALFDLGAALATPRTEASAIKIEKTRFDLEGTEKLEDWIDEMEKSMPPLKTFILPGGHPSASALHLARSISRRAERIVIPLYQHADVNQHVMAYLNRLSDYLFVTSRYVNHLAVTPETTWQPHKLTKT